VLPPGVVPLAADLADRASLDRGFATLDGSLDTLVYAAAADAGDEASYRRAYVDGLRHVLDALAARGVAPRHAFFTSSTGVYAQDDGSAVDESSPTEPTGFRGTLMLEAERVLAASALPYTVLRLGGIYGPGRTRMIESVRSGRATRRPGRHFGNRIHRDDAAGALAHLVTQALHGVAVPPLLIGVDHEPADEAEVLGWIATQIDVAPPPVGEGEPVTTGKRCANARLLASGYRFAYPTFREGYGAELLQIEDRPLSPRPVSGR
jgi:nucleoside-diphosphate-sugar epimerase